MPLPLTRMRCPIQTVEFGRGCFKGSAGHGSVDGQSPPAVNVYGPDDGPVIAVLRADDLTVEDMAFHGQKTGICEILQKTGIL